VPGECVKVPDEACRLDRTVEDVRGLGRPGQDPEARPKGRNEERKLISVCGCTTEVDAPAGVIDPCLEAVEVQLGRGEMGERIDSARDDVVREAVDDVGRLVALRARLGSRSRKRGRPGLDRVGGGEERGIVERSSSFDGPGCPTLASRPSRPRGTCRLRARS